MTACNGACYRSRWHEATRMPWYLPPYLKTRTTKQPKTQQGPTSPARSLHSQRSSQSSSSNTHNNVLLSVSDSLRSGKRSEELQEGRRMLQAEHRRRVSELMK